MKKSLFGESIKNKSLKKIKNNKIKEIIHAEINPDFNSDREMVIRKSEFKDERTFAVKADKGASQLNRDLIRFLKEKNCVINIVIFDYY